MYVHQNNIPAAYKFSRGTNQNLIKKIIFFTLTTINKTNTCNEIAMKLSFNYSLSYMSIQHSD